MFSFFSDLAKGFVGLIWPPVCEVCNRKINEENPGSLCKDCAGKIKLVTPAAVKRNNVNIWAVCAYEGVSRECIHLLKYKARLGLAKPLSRLMLDFTKKYLKNNKFDIIVPVPLHKNRLRERTFNQSEVLAKNLARPMGLCLCAKAIKRTKPTLAQAGLSKTKRFANLRGAFKIGAADLVAAKDILLVDDVLTTGSTINECARVLLKARAKSVSALVLAKGIQ